MELGREPRYLEIFLTVGWALVFYVQAHLIVARIQKDHDWSAVPRLLDVSRYAALAVLAASLFLMFENSMSAWGHSLFAPTILALWVSEIGRLLVRKLTGSGNWRHPKTT